MHFKHMHKPPIWRNLPFGPGPKSSNLMQSPYPAGAAAPRLMTVLGLLWLAGIGMRIALLNVPPMLPSIHADLHMTETQVGILTGLPFILFALAAVPGSLLVSRLGALLTTILGLVILSFAAAGRGAAIDVWTLYAATIVMGFGTAIMQPALPTLVREWLPERIVLGTASYTNGMIVGTTLAAAFTIPYVLPMVGQSWRLGFVVWAAPSVLAAMLLILFAPRQRQNMNAPPAAQLWWPDWKSPLTWMLGVTFATNTGAFFGTNAFLPDFLTHQGRADLISPALGWLNGAQLLASLVLLAMAQRLQGRAWPFLIFGPISIVSLFAILVTDGIWIVISAGVFGFAIAVTFVVLLALPALLSHPDDVPRTAAGMFTISYSFSTLVPIICGALWDLTGISWTSFVPLLVSATALTILGTVLSLKKHG
jgi:CP family cyanate transporter-like MFS transporter